MKERLFQQLKARGYANVRIAMAGEFLDYCMQRGILPYGGSVNFETGYKVFYI